MGDLSVSPNGVTAVTLLYGDFPDLARQVLDSLARFVVPHGCRVLVGGNSISAATRRVLDEYRDSRVIDKMLLSEKNRGKCAMMRRLLREVDSDLIWWFDDDAYVSRIGALPYWLRLVASSKPRVAQWGDAVYCSDIRPYVSEGDPIRFVREAEWYQGLPPPSWRAGGKGEFDFRGKGMGDGRWRFVIGSIWMARASRLKEMDWPDRRLFRNGEDIYLGEALRQHGYSLGRVNLHEAGVVLSAAVRRGAAEEPKVYHDSEEWHLEIVE